jgi:hypothetical protein
MGDHILPYRNSELGILILYYLITGKDQGKMKIPQSSFSKIKHEFDITKNENTKTLDLFNNKEIRILSAKISNPIDLNLLVYFMMDMIPELIVNHQKK